VSKLKSVIGLTISAGFIFALGISPLQPAQAASWVNLGSAGNYQILSGSAITVGAGSVGIDPAFDGVSSSAVADLAAAISAASGLSGVTVSADLGGVTYTPGVYLSPGGAAFAMTGNVILSGAGIFIFYTPAALNITAGVITMLNGATAANVYWIAGGAITIGASSTLEGIFMSSAAITTGASNTFTGCLLAAAAVSVGASNIFNPCPLTEPVSPSGALSISAPSDCAIPDASAGGIATAETGDIVVTDTRVGNGATSWTAAVMASTLSDANNDQILPSAIGYSVLGLTQTGGITTTSTNQGNFSATISSIVVSATGPGSPNSSTWHAQLKISIPLNQPIGSYSGILTHSVY
jgi:hypothetical protein